MADDYTSLPMVKHTDEDSTTLPKNLNFQLETANLEKDSPYHWINKFYHKVYIHMGNM